MSTLHGECTPQTLQNLLNIPSVDAKKYITQLIADGALKPNPLLKKSVSEFAKTNDNSIIDKIKKRLDMKSQSEVVETEETSELPELQQQDELKILESFEATKSVDIETEGRPDDGVYERVEADVEEVSPMKPEQSPDKT